MKRRVMHVVASALMVSVMSVPAWAIGWGGIQNGGFETPPTPWETIGAAGVVDDFGGAFPPAQGNYQAVMTNGGASQAELEDFLGLSAGALDSLIGVGDLIEPNVMGAAIRQDFWTDGPAELWFKWRFAAASINDLGPSVPGNGNGDFYYYPITAIYALDGDYWVLASDQSAPFTTTVNIEGFFADMTDWIGEHRMITGEGDHRLGFAVFGAVFAPAAPGEDYERDGGEDFSAILTIDDVMTEIIPEPVTAGLSMLGFAALGWSLRRRRAA